MKRQIKSPKFTLAVDASQIDTFLQCPTLWHYKYQRNLAIDKEEGLALIKGTFGHHILDQYYKMLAVHKDLVIPDKVSKAWAWAQETAKNIPPDYPLEESHRKEIMDKLFEYMCCHSSGNDIVPINPESVELGFSKLLYEDDSNYFVVEGRIDFIGELGAGLTGFVDHKFQMWRKTDLYNKSVQFKTYAWATGYLFGLINYVRLTKKTDEDTFARKMISFRRDEIVRWEKTLVATLFKMKAAILANSWEQNADYWRNPSSCSGKYGYECEYTSICEETYPPIMEAKMKLYHIKPEWRPW